MGYIVSNGMIVKEEWRIIWKIGAIICFNVVFLKETKEDQTAEGLSSELRIELRTFPLQSRNANHHTATCGPSVILLRT
jgi:hypothetical protein